MEEAQKWETPIAERVRKAREKAQQKKDKEQALYQSIYTKYRYSWQIWFAGFMAVCSILLIFLLVYDIVMPSEIVVKTIVGGPTDVKQSQSINPIYNEYRIWAGNESIPVSLQFFTICKTNHPITIERGRFFGEIKRLSVKSNGVAMHEEPNSFFNDSWILFIILLCLPFASFFFMKPNFIFAFVFVQYNLYLQPLLMVYLLGGSGRIFHLFATVFH